MMRRLLVVFATLLLVDCANLQLFVANVASAGGPYILTQNIAYGREPRQKLDIYHPESKPGAATQGQLPVVVFFHGGRWSEDSKDDYRFVGATLAEHGWLGIVPSYRLYPKVKFPAFVEDAALAVAWVQQHAAAYGGDPRRLFVMGHSAGAHLALLITLDRRYLAAVGSTASAIRGAIGLSGPYDFLPYPTDYIKGVFAGAADPLDTQPIHFARADAPPILLVHGGADEMVATRNSISLAAALERLGGDVTLKIYQGGSHGDTVAGFSNLRREGPPVLDDVARFIAAHP
jgi:acetyl esterase/lipase